MAADRLVRGAPRPVRCANRHRALLRALGRGARGSLHTGLRAARFRAPPARHAMRPSGHRLPRDAVDGYVPPHRRERLHRHVQRARARPRRDSDRRAGAAAGDHRRCRAHACLRLVQRAPRCGLRDRRHARRAPGVARIRDRVVDARCDARAPPVRRALCGRGVLSCAAARECTRPSLATCRPRAARSSARSRASFSSTPSAADCRPALFAYFFAERRAGAAPVAMLFAADACSRVRTVAAGSRSASGS